jgi:hypothetical protein
MIAMLGTVWAIFRGNIVLQIATAVVLGWGALKANNVYQRHVGRDQGRVEVATKIKEKADKNVKTANSVRDAVGVGAGGVQHPYQRRP